LFIWFNLQIILKFLDDTIWNYDGFNTYGRIWGDLSQNSLKITETVIDSGIAGFDLSILFVIITIILGGLTVYCFWKSKKSL